MARLCLLLSWFFASLAPVLLTIAALAVPVQEVRADTGCEFLPPGAERDDCYASACAEANSGDVAGHTGCCKTYCDATYKAGSIEHATCTANCEMAAGDWFCFLVCSCNKNQPCRQWPIVRPCKKCTCYPDIIDSCDIPD